MNIKLQYLLVALATAALIACGGEDPSQVECADGTEFDEDANECVLVQPDCDDDEIFVEDFNTCVPEEEGFCGEGTVYDEQQEACVFDPELECGPNTVEEDDQCIDAVETSCGEGTVLVDGQCRPEEDVCADGTQDASEEEGVVDCRPGEQLCGSGTIYDADIQRCVAESNLECGPGTVALEDGDSVVCVPAQSYYEDLAEQADVDLSDDDVTSIDLADQDQRKVFVGTIEAPVDGEQQEDKVSIGADEGQWLEITVYSLGLPEPGFEFEDDGAATSYYRRSDLGAGLETTRQIVLPADGEYELTVGNMPQMLGYGEPAGGDDWDYVGYVETMSAPQPFVVEGDDVDFQGDLRESEHNLYGFADADDIANLQLHFDQLPEDADAQLQVWDDESTLVESKTVDTDLTSIDTPGDAFTLFFDYEYADGFSTDYSAIGRHAHPIDAGDTFTKEVELAGGEYLRLSQFNTDEATVSATISDGEGTKNPAHSDELISSGSEEYGQKYLHWYASDDESVFIEIENDGVVDLASVVPAVDINYSTQIGNIDGSYLEYDWSGSLDTEQRHYFELDVDYDDRLMVSIDHPDAHIVLIDEVGDPIASGRDDLYFEAEPQVYAMYAEVAGSVDDGFGLSFDQTDLFTFEGSAEPEDTQVPTGEQPVSASIDVDNCPVIYDIEASVEIIHSYREDVIVVLTGPDDESYRLHNESGGSLNDIIGTYPNPSDPDLEDGEVLLEAIGTGGEGEWTMEVIDTWATVVSQGDFMGWELRLVCEDGQPEEPGADDDDAGDDNNGEDDNDTNDD